MGALEAKDKKIYDFIRKSIAETGYSPSIRDIQLSLGIKSTSTVHSSLCRLESDGLIVRDGGKSRAIRLVTNESSACRIPVLSRLKSAVSFGHEHNFSGYIDFALPDGMQQGDVFAYKISGDGVERLGIFDGDYIIIYRTDEVTLGDIVAVASNGDLSIMPFSRIGQSTTLIGKVIASIKYF